MSDYKHILPALVPLLERPGEKRIEYIKLDRWLGYSRANEILKKMDDLVTHPRVIRMPGMMVVGRTNNGKSHILERFAQKHAPSMNFGGEKICAPVLYIESPPGPDETALYIQILLALYEQVPSAGPAAIRQRALKVLEEIQLKVLVIDELHSMLAGSSKKHQLMLNAIKNISNQLKVSIVAGGTADLLRAVAVDPQVQNRLKPELLPLWGTDAGTKQLLKSFEATLPLRLPSNLQSQTMVNKIIAMSEGTIGEISALLKDAAIKAIESGVEQITPDILNHCGFVPPSDRAAQAAKV